MSITQTIRQEITVNQSQLDIGNRGFAANGTAEMPITGALGVLAKRSQRCRMSISMSFEVQ